ncbi:hypothetical protein [Prochlorococcus marinus]|nr:hypothetical protein [Prochlorococcus marinus]
MTKISIKSLQIIDLDTFKNAGAKILKKNMNLFGDLILDGLYN